MTQTIRAIFENGVFRPLDPDKLEIAEGQQVQINVPVYIPDLQEIEESMSLLTSVLDGLTPQEVDEFERIALNRSGCSSCRSDR